MTEALARELADVVERISAPSPVVVPPAPGVTGVLAELAGWWHGLSPDGRLAATWLRVPTGADVDAALAAGVQAADRAIDAGATLIVPRAEPRDEARARTLIALLARKESSVVVHQGPGMTDRQWMHTCADVRDRAARAAPQMGSPVALLRAVDAPGVAGVVGILLTAAARRTPCLVDGTDELAAALVADRICYRAKGWWRAGSDSPDGGRTVAADRIELSGGLPLQLTDADGRGAQATLNLLEMLAG